MFVIRMLDPNRRLFFFPAGMGTRTHELTTKVEDAASFKTEAQARARLQSHRSPPAFWESERAHRDMMIRRYRGWQFFIMELSRTLELKAL